MKQSEYCYKKLENIFRRLEAEECLQNPSVILRRLAITGEECGYELPAFIYFSHHSIIEKYDECAKFKPIKMLDDELEWRINRIRNSYNVYTTPNQEEYNPKFLFFIQNTFRAYMIGRKNISKFILNKYKKLISQCLNTPEFESFLDCLNK
ncbi:MAG: hypothetical protein IJ220_07595 [Clostridia bacterium]|nr:hypothetical protein [Clostridia bacterium]